MRRTALLIGSETYGLTGVGNDVDTVADLLARRGFAAVRCEGRLATRAGILDAYERLIRNTGTDDTVIVYYSGHGGLLLPPPAHAQAARDTPPRLQFIVPTDYAESTPADFRGVTAAELSVLLVRLTAATRNVTVILDTCHAAHLSRDDDLRVRALPRPAYADVAEHLSRLRRRGLDTAVRQVLGNQDAVRIVACGRDASAYEYTGSTGRCLGVLTDSLARTLDEVGDHPVTWVGMMPRIRARMSAIVPWQQPEAEGPAHRLIFQSVAERSPTRPDRPALHTPVAVEWGLVIDGRATPLPMTGAVVADGEHAYVRVRNDGATTVYVTVLEFDVLSRTSLVTSLDPSGVPLGAEEEQVIGRDELDGRLVGFPLSWPPDAGPPALRPAGLVVIIASAPDAPTEVMRDLAIDTTVRHDVHRISFRLGTGPSGKGLDAPTTTDGG